MVLGAITGIAALCFSIGGSQFVDVGGGPLIIFIIVFALGAPLIFFIVGLLKMLMCIVYIIIAGTSLVHIMRNFKKKSSVTNKYSIDYDLIILVCPVAASGAFFGVITKNLISEMLLTTLEVFLMLYLIYRTCKQNKILASVNFSMFSKQQPALNEGLLANNSSPGLNEQIQIPLRNMGQDKHMQSRYMYEQSNPELNKIFEQEANRVPKNKIKILSVVFLYTIFLFFVKRASQWDLVIINPPLVVPDDFINGTQPEIVDHSIQKQHYKQYQKELQSKIQKYTGQNIGANSYGQSQQYYDPFQYTVKLKSCVFSTLACLLVHLTLSYLSSKSVAIQTVAKQTQKQKYGYVFVKETDKMSSKKMWNCMIAGFFGGVFVGLLGIGASIILVPTWINQQIDQQTAVDSSVPVTLFSSIISIMVSAFHNFYVPYPYLLLILIFIISSLITMLTYFLFNKMADGNITKNFTKIVKFILYISSFIALVVYYMIQYSFNQRYYTNFGYFC